MADVEGLRLEIDEFRLDEEWVGQPSLYFCWARKQADASLRLDGAKSELDLVRANLDADVRNDPAKYGIIKITEAAVSNVVLGDADHQAATKRVAKAKYDLEVIKAAVNALDHRKSALEMLVRLHGQSYFAEPRADGSSGEGMAEAEKRILRRKGVPRQ